MRIVGSVVWGGLNDRGALHLEPRCPRLVRAVQLDQAEVVRVERSGRLTAREVATGYLRQGPRCQFCNGE